MARALNDAGIRRARRRRRALLGLALALPIAGCYRPPAQGSARALAVWHELERSAAQGPGGSAATDPAAIEGPRDAALDAERALALALERSPSVAADDAQADVADARIAAARQIRNPELRLTDARLDDLLAGRPTLDTALRVPVPRPGSRDAKIRGAEQGASAARAQGAEARRLLRVRIFALYARLAHLHADLDEVTRLAELAGQRRELIASRVDRAVATRLDLALAEVAAGEAQAELARVREQIAATEDEVRRLVLGGPEIALRVDPRELELRDLALDRGALIERALSERGALQGAQGKIGEATAAAYLARNAVWPWPTWMQAGYQVSPGSSSGAFAFGMAIDLPIFSWNRGEIRAADALVRQRELEERALVATIATEVDAAIARAGRTHERVVELDRSVLEPLDRAAEEAQRALEAGALDPLKMLEIEAHRGEARRQRLSALLDHRRAILELEAAVGGRVR